MSIDHLNIPPAIIRSVEDYKPVVKPQSLQDTCNRIGALIRGVEQCQSEGNLKDAMLLTKELHATLAIGMRKYLPDADWKQMASSQLIASVPPSLSCQLDPSTCTVHPDGGAPKEPVPIDS